MAVITGLYACYHVGHLAALAVHKQVISQLDAVPVLVTVHGIETTDNGCYYTCTHIVYMLLHISDEALASSWVSISTIHKAVYVAVRDVILLGYVNELQQVV